MGFVFSVIFGSCEESVGQNRVQLYRVRGRRGKDLLNANEEVRAAAGGAPGAASAPNVGRGSPSVLPTERGSLPADALCSPFSPPNVAACRRMLFAPHDPRLLSAPQEEAAALLERGDEYLQDEALARAQADPDLYASELDAEDDLPEELSDPNAASLLEQVEIPRENDENDDMNGRDYVHEELDEGPVPEDAEGGSSAFEKPEELMTEEERQALPHASVMEERRRADEILGRAFDEEQERLAQTGVGRTREGGGRRSSWGGIDVRTSS